MSCGSSGRLVSMASADGTDDVWGVVVVRGRGSEATLGRLVGPRPDLGTVDALARLQLAARQLGFSICLRAIHPRLGELLDLAGLAGAGLLLEAGRQPEGGEPLGIEET